MSYLGTIPIGKLKEKKKNIYIYILFIAKKIDWLTSALFLSLDDSFSDLLTFFMLCSVFDFKSASTTPAGFVTLINQHRNEKLSSY